MAFDRQWFYPEAEQSVGSGSPALPGGGKDYRVVTFDRLEDWAKRPEDAVKYYSGTATYRKSFEFPASADDRLQRPASRVWLDLGDVQVIARVRLNGIDCGVAWTRPYRVDITKALKTGANQLDVEVANLWPNRLTGDTFLPKEQRRTKTNMTKYTQSSQLLPSGLLGPVCVMAEE